jgi:hypothetical protein
LLRRSYHNWMFIQYQGLAIGVEKDPEEINPSFALIEQVGSGCAAYQEQQSKKSKCGIAGTRIALSIVVYYGASLIVSLFSVPVNANGTW